MKATPGVATESVHPAMGRDLSWKRTRVTSAVVAAMGLMPAMALAVDLLPKRSDFNAYQVLLSHSPFAVATMIPRATPGLPNDVYIANVACTDDNCTVRLMSLKDENFEKKLPMKRPNERDFSDIYIDLRP